MKLRVASGVLLLIAGTALSQAQTKSASAAYVAPRTNFGKPDFQGIWQAWNTALYNLEAHIAATGIHAGMSFVVDPIDGKIPYLPAARAKQIENFEHREERDPVGRCFIPGPQRFVYMGFPFQIFETAKFVQFDSEYAHSVRTIYMEKQTHYDESLDFWIGDSRGKWDGETLVVDVANNNDMTWFDASGNHHSGALKVVERFTRTGRDILRYEATLTDPMTYSKPWTIRMDLHRNTDPKAQLLEYECQSYTDDDKARREGRK